MYVKLLNSKICKGRMFFSHEQPSNLPPAPRRDEHLLYISGLGTWSGDLQSQLRLQQPRMCRQSVTWHRRGITCHRPFHCLFQVAFKVPYKKKALKWIRITRCMRFWGYNFIAKVMRLKIQNHWKKLRTYWHHAFNVASHVDPSLRFVASAFQRRFGSQDLSWHSQRPLEDMCFGCGHLCHGFHQQRGTRKPGSCRFLAKVSTSSWNLHL